MLQAKLRRVRYSLLRAWRERSLAVDRTFVSCLVALATLIIQPSVIGVRADSTLLRNWFLLRGPRPAPESLAILRLDNRTKEALGVPDRDPIPRSAIADAILKLMKYNPKAIIFDVIFDDEGPSPEVDKQLAAALAQSPSVIGRSSLLDIDGRKRDGTPLMARRKTDSYSLFVHSAKYVVAEQATLTANVVEKISLLGDPTLEKAPLLLPLRELVDPTLEEPGDFDFINYYGEPFTIPSLPMHKLLADDSAWSGLFSNKVIFVGWTDRSINGLTPDKRDSFMTPVSSTSMYGVEIQATIAANLLDRTWLHRLPFVTEVFTLFGVAFVLSFLATSMSWTQFVPMIVAAGVFWLGFSFIAFVQFYYFIPGLTVFGIVMPVFMLFAAIAEGRREARARQKSEESIGIITPQKLKTLHGSDISKDKV